MSSREPSPSPCARADAAVGAPAPPQRRALRGPRRRDRRGGGALPPPPAVRALRLRAGATTASRGDRRCVRRRRRPLRGACAHRAAALDAQRARRALVADAACDPRRHRARKGDAVAGDLGVGGTDGVHGRPLRPGSRVEGRDRGHPDPRRDAGPGWTSCGGGASSLAVIIATLHVIAAGAWVGTLFHLWRSVRSVSEATVGAMLRAFHPVALGSAGLLAATGAYQAWIALSGVRRRRPPCTDFCRGPIAARRSAACVPTRNVATVIHWTFAC